MVNILFFCNSFLINKYYYCCYMLNPLNKYNELFTKLRLSHHLNGDRLLLNLRINQIDFSFKKQILLLFGGFVFLFRLWRVYLCYRFPSLGRILQLWQTIKWSNVQMRCMHADGSNPRDQKSFTLLSRLSVCINLRFPLLSIDPFILVFSFDYYSRLLLS